MIAYNRPDQLSATLGERVFEVAGGSATAARTGRSPAAEGAGRGCSRCCSPSRVAHSLLDAHAVAFVQGLAEGWEPQGGGLVLLSGQPGSASAPVRDAIVDAFCLFSVPREHPAAQAVLGRRSPLVCVDEPRLDRVPFVGIDERPTTTRPPRISHGSATGASRS